MAFFVFNLGLSFTLLVDLNQNWKWGFSSKAILEISLKVSVIYKQWFAGQILKKKISLYLVESNLGSPWNKFEVVWVLKSGCALYFKHI